VAKDEDNPAEAIRSLQEALTTFKQLGDQSALAETLISLAETPDPSAFGELSANLIGAAEAMGAALGVPMTPDTPRHRRIIQSIRSTLGSVGFEEALAKGRTWSIEQAYEVAMTFSADRISRPLPRPAEQSAVAFQLTPREIDVLRMLAAGLSTQEIADQLSISPRTVSTHINNMLGKTGVDSRAALVALSFRSGIL
jgi:DNA-binding CsgD family transcriptional regulator